MDGLLDSIVKIGQGLAIRAIAGLWSLFAPFLSRKAKALLIPKSLGNRALNLEVPTPFERWLYQFKKSGRQWFSLVGFLAASLAIGVWHVHRKPIWEQVAAWFAIVCLFVYFHYSLAEPMPEWERNQIAEFGLDTKLGKIGFAIGGLFFLFFWGGLLALEIYLFYFL
jgi:hypothetical protein